MWETSYDRVVRIGDVWIRASAVEAIQGTKRESVVKLRNGTNLVVDATQDDIAHALWDQPGPEGGAS